MKISVPISILLLWMAFLPFAINAQQIKIYKSNATADILESDIAFAKSRAFHQAQQNAIIAAIQELVEPQIFEEYRNQIIRRQSLNPKNHLVSVRILNEFNNEKEFTIELEAKIQIDTLSDALKQMDLVFKDDVWLPITLLIENALDFPIDQLASRLQTFHIKLDKIEKVSFIGIPDAERKEKAFIGDLFHNYPQNRVIYLLETTADDEIKKNDAFDPATKTESGRQIIGFQLRIFRQSDLEEINKILLKLPPEIPVNSDNLSEVVGALIPRLTSMLTINSIKRNTYENGLASSYLIDVSGLNTPALRSTFEQQVFKVKQAINSFSLIQLSIDMCRYVIQSSADLDTLIEDLRQANPYFELKVENPGFNTVLINAFYHYVAIATQPESWIPDDRVIDRIKESFQDLTVLAGTDNKETQLHKFYVPTLIEKEPNNSNIQFNSIPASTYVLGKVENRSDEDIFELKGLELSDSQLEFEFFHKNIRETKVKTLEKEPGSDKDGPTDVTLLKDEIQEGATIYIDWIQIGKTALAPQLRLYDENFNFISAFSLVRSQKRRRFKYPFSQSIPEKVYIRISDKIGFIQGETGGFKQYQYMVRYSWSDESDLEPENPIVQMNQ